MNLERDTAALLTALRLVMKNKGLKYRDVARHLRVSIPTVKRLFSTGEMPLQRLLQITHWLGLTLGELTKIAESHTPGHTKLTQEQEEFFAQNTMMIAYFFALKRGKRTPAQIAERFKLTPHSTRRYLEGLESQRLIRVLSDSKVKVLAERGLEWSDRGPLGRAITQKVVTNFVHHACANIEKSKTLKMRTSGWSLTEREFAELAADVDTLLDKYRRISHPNALASNPKTKYVSTLWLADEWDDPMYEEIKNI